MDFRHLIVTCLFSMLRLSFETQKIKKNYAILFEKNTLFSGSHEAAHAAAIFFSLMGCCRENKVNPKLWMQDVLIRVQDKERVEKNNYSDLLPFNWKG